MLAAKPLTRRGLFDIEPTLEPFLTALRNVGTILLARVTPWRALKRSGWMPITIESLRRRMDEAVASLDFEEAGRCRDMINAIRGGAEAGEAEEGIFEGLSRQQPGAMGLGTSQQRVTPPADWRAPPKPDPMTTGRSKRGRRRSS